jgi:hypothetical protein
LLLYFEEGNPKKHVAPDVFLVRGVPKLPPRDYYLVWKEGKTPDLVIEITSKTTRREDQTKKRSLYRDVLKVPEYFQFDPTEDYLKPSMQGHQLVDGQYVPIAPVAGRLPSAVLDLHLERRGAELRLYDPATRRCLLTPTKRAACGGGATARGGGATACGGCATACGGGLSARGQGPAAGRGRKPAAAKGTRGARRRAVRRGLSIVLQAPGERCDGTSEKCQEPFYLIIV